MRKQTLTVLAVLLFTSGVHAAPPEATNGMAALRRATAAAAKLGDISYHARYHGEGPLAAYLQKVTARVVARRATPGYTDRMYIEAEATTPGSDTPVPMKIASDGNKAYFIYDREKTYSTGKISEMDNLPIAPIMPRRFLGDQPFHREMRALGVRHAGFTNLGGTQCEVIKVQYDAKGHDTATLYLGKDDGLLRRFDKDIGFRPNNQPGVVTGKVVMTVANIDTHPRVDDALFHPECPAGYQRQEITPAVAAVVGGPPVVGSVAPAWSLRSSEGAVVNSKDLRGKIVIIDFWATWCGPCKMAMPGLQKLHEQFKGRPVEVLGLNVWERQPDPMNFIRQKGYTYRQLLGADQVATAYGVRGIPTIYVIGPDGKVLDMVRGFDPGAEQRFAALIERTLQKGS